MASLRFLVLIFILAANGFFAAAEVSLVSVRQSRLRELAEQGQAGAQSALNLLANPGRLFSVTQLGVTLASLGLGWAGEDTVYILLRDLLTRFHLPMTAVSCMGCVCLGFLGHQLRARHHWRSCAQESRLEKADRVAVLAAPALLIFYRLSQPLIIVIERSAEFVLRLLGLRKGKATAAIPLKN